MKTFKLKNKAEGTKTKTKKKERENERKGKRKKGTRRQECKGVGPVLNELPGDFCFPKALDFWILISMYTLKF